jgi:hypothetical protein
MKAFLDIAPSAEGALVHCASIAAAMPIRLDSRVCVLPPTEDREGFPEAGASTENTKSKNCRKSLTFSGEITYD